MPHQLHIRRGGDAGGDAGDDGAAGHDGAAVAVVVPNGSSLAVEWTGHHHHTVASRANEWGTWVL